MPDLRLDDLDGLDADHRDRVRVVYEAGFPAHLRAPWSEVTTGRTATEEPLALVDGDAPVGFVLLRDFPGTDRVYLRYLVVDASRRGSGLGSAAWPLLLAHAAAEGDRVLVWDVEHPDEGGLDDAERSLRRRRIGFYERQGGQVLAVSGYTNPHGDHEVPMVLMAAGTGADGDAALPTSAAWAEDLRRDVEQHRWGR